MYRFIAARRRAQPWHSVIWRRQKRNAPRIFRLSGARNDAEASDSRESNAQRSTWAARRFYPAGLQMQKPADLSMAGYSLRHTKKVTGSKKKPRRAKLKPGRSGDRRFCRRNCAAYRVQCGLVRTTMQRVRTKYFALAQHPRSCSCHPSSARAACAPCPADRNSESVSCAPDPTLPLLGQPIHSAPL